MKKAIQFVKIVFLEISKISHMNDIIGLMFDIYGNIVIKAVLSV